MGLINIKPCKERSKMWEIGYKLYDKTKNGFLSYYQDNDTCLYQIGKIYKAVNKEIQNSRGEFYTSGFHIFKKNPFEHLPARISDDDRHIFCKVAYRDILCEGQQISGQKLHDCIVANEIKILEVLHTSPILFSFIN